MMPILDRPSYMNKLSRYRDVPLVKILTGVRRCGKSTLLKLFARNLSAEGVPPDHILQYNFDSLEHEALKTAGALYQEIKTKLKEGRTYLFLDEIQEVDNWERAVNTLLENGNVDIYVTGSNSRLMSSEISTYLTGRYVSIPVFPLSFSEFLFFRSRFTKVEAPAHELARYLKLGGFPALHLKDYEADEAYQIVRDIYNSTIFSDIVRRNEIRKIDQLERIVRFTFDNVGCPFSASSISKYLKSENRRLDNETLYSYLKKLETAYLLYRCPRYDLKGKEILKTQEKFYLADTALRYGVLGYRPDTAAAMLENMVYLELLRRGWRVFVGKFGTAEIDFIAERREDRMYIQISQEIVSEATERREYGRLLELRDNYPKYVLRTDAFAGGNIHGIQTLHVADFLLSDAY